MRIYLVNVGANSSHNQLFSPLFEDGTFEFLPIPEGTRNLEKSRRAVYYRDLRSYYKPDRSLLCYVPREMWGVACHNDPDFEAFTYGDSGTNGRSSALAHLRRGDGLLFLARLECSVGGKRTRQPGFYLIGGLWVDHVRFVTLNSHGREKFANNAHVIRGDRHFLGIAGSSRSRRFEYAIPITREICDKVFRDKNGNQWTWSNGKSELSRIGSYTRTCRIMLDTADPEQAQRCRTLRAWIEKHSGEKDAELLAMR